EDPMARLATRFPHTLSLAFDPEGREEDGTASYAQRLRGRSDQEIAEDFVAHTGQDFAVPTGTPVRAVGSGTVVSVTCGDAFGNAVIIDHGNGYYSQYAHLSVTEVAQGQYIAVGQRLGRSGSTGNSTGPHLHFEIRLTPYVGSAIDPAPWLRDHGVTL
ncbi:M23 family metallopeptidase, partial [Streptomyces sp. NPDC059853]|uniref:M23 family metallopeptidase n=1 Tax=Streptomyces sp. NPDC059853 TaxID=3346973 RepID=UPI00364B3B0F